MRGTLAHNVELFAFAGAWVATVIYVVVLQFREWWRGFAPGPKVRRRYLFKSRGGVTGSLGPMSGRGSCHITCRFLLRRPSFRLAGPLTFEAEWFDGVGRPLGVGSSLHGRSGIAEYRMEIESAGRDSWQYEIRFRCGSPRRQVVRVNVKLELAGAIERVSMPPACTIDRVGNPGFPVIVDGDSHRTE